MTILDAETGRVVGYISQSLRSKITLRFAFLHNRRPFVFGRFPSPATARRELMAFDLEEVEA